MLIILYVKPCFLAIEQRSKITLRGCPKPRNDYIFPHGSTTLWGSLLKHRALSRVGLATSLVLGLSGCFKYIPTQLEAAPPGEEVRLLMTRQAGVELSEVTGIDLSRPVIRGEILGREGTELLLNVPVGRRREGFHTVQLKQTIRVPFEEVVRIDRREFSRLNTGLLAVGSVGASILLVQVIIKTFGEVEVDDPIDPPEFKFNFFSIPIGD